MAPNCQLKTSVLTTTGIHCFCVPCHLVVSDFCVDNVNCSVNQWWGGRDFAAKRNRSRQNVCWLFHEVFTF